MLRPSLVLTNTVYPCVYREHLRFNNPERTGAGLSLCIQGTQS